MSNLKENVHYISYIALFEIVDKELSALRKNIIVDNRAEWGFATYDEALTYAQTLKANLENIESTYTHEKAYSVKTLVLSYSEEQVGMIEDFYGRKKISRTRYHHYVGESKE